jgi:hypothetical protein
MAAEEALEVSVPAFEKQATKAGVKLADDLEEKAIQAIEAFAGPNTKKGTAIAVVLGAKLLDRAPQ